MSGLADRSRGRRWSQFGSIGNAAPGCNPSGIRRDRGGNLFIADANQGGVIWKLTAADRNPAAPFATGVPGTNGLAFDRRGNIWTGDGTTGQGRVWKVSPDGKTVTEMFRIQPMRNSTALGATQAGDGRRTPQVRSFPPGTLANTLGGQDLVANGVDFDRNGDLIVADTARGALWRVEFDGKGNVTSRTGCDTTFTANTLCLENVLVAHPLLEGTDGISIDRAGTIWNAANERNAIVAVTRGGRVVEVFRNPPNAAGLRNAADTADGNEHILELPTSPFYQRRSAVRGAIGRQPARQLAQHRRRSQRRRTRGRTRQDLVPGPAAERRRRSRPQLSDGSSQREPWRMTCADVPGPWARSYSR